MARAPVLAFLVGDETLQLEGFGVVDVLCFGGRARATVHVATVVVVLCAWIIVVGGWFGGFGPGADSIDVEEDVDDWVKLVFVYGVGGLGGLQR